MQNNVRKNNTVYNKIHKNKHKNTELYTIQHCKYKASDHLNTLNASTLNAKSAPTLVR